MAKKSVVASTGIAATASLPCITSLSFVHWPKRGAGSYWHLPALPDAYIEAQRVNPDGTSNSRDVALYGIGCQQGTAAAREYLGFLRTAKESPRDVGGYLQRIVLSMLDAPRDDLLKGQVVGFFATLEMEALTRRAA